MFDSKSWGKLLTLFTLIILLSACARGTSLSNTTGLDFSSVPEGKARVFIYRKGELVGSAIQPTVKINGRETQICQPNSVFIAELDEGQHSFLVTTEVDKRLDLNLKAGETRYVECRIGFGLIVGRIHLIEITDIADAEKVTRRLVYTGTFSQ